MFYIQASNTVSILLQNLGHTRTHARTHNVTLIYALLYLDLRYYKD